MEANPRRGPAGREAETGDDFLSRRSTVALGWLAPLYASSLRRRRDELGCAIKGRQISPYSRSLATPALLGRQVSSLSKLAQVHQGAVIDDPGEASRLWGMKSHRSFAKK
jgi:hypothetical protein